MTFIVARALGDNLRCSRVTRHKLAAYTTSAALLLKMFQNMVKKTFVLLLSWPLRAHGLPVFRSLHEQQQTNSAPFPRADHHYIDPPAYLNNKRTRGSCPALNALANHGYIPRDGQNITLQQLSAAASEVLGISSYMTTFDTLQIFQRNELPYTELDSGDISINLQEIYVEKRQGSLLKLDMHISQDLLGFEVRGREARECLIDRMLSHFRAKSIGSDLITIDDFYQYQLLRKLDSRIHNPYFKFTLQEVFVMSGIAIQVASFAGNVATNTINVTVMEELIRYNRFVDGFIPAAAPQVQDYISGPEVQDLVERNQDFQEEILTTSLDYLKKKHNLTDDAICYKTGTKKKELGFVSAKTNARGL